MKKTENINLGGKAFIIDLDAFKALDRYVNAVESKFKRKSEKDEIMDDIEIRMAEILEENLMGREIVSLKDIHQLQKTMGAPEDFMDEEPTKTNYANKSKTESTGGTDNTTRVKTKRLYRDIDHKVFGGVCAGISNYFGIDKPIWVRLLFAFSFFFVGSGMFLYILLWIVLPAAMTPDEVEDMKSDPVDLDDLTSTIKSEVLEVKDTLQNIVKN